MVAFAFLFARALFDCFKSRRRLEAEILVLRLQLKVLQRRAPGRLYLTWADRALFVWVYCRFPRILDAVTIVRPETIVRWHRNGYGVSGDGSPALSVVDRELPRTYATLSGERVSRTRSGARRTFMVSFSSSASRS